MRRGSALVPAAKYLVVAVALVAFLFPVYWMVLMAVKPESEWKASPPVFLPRSWHPENFLGALHELNGFKGLWDSLSVSFGTTLFSMILATLAAYSIARFRTGGQNLSFFILSQLFLPPVAVILPLFLLWRQVGMIDTHAALIITYTVFDVPFATWILKGFFEEIPAQMEEAALTDGASRMRAFWDITLPQAGPGLVVTALFCFIFAWNEFIFATILSRRVVTTLPFLIPALMSSHDIKWGYIGAIATVAAIPVVILTFALQRYLVRGLSFGAVKGK